MYTLLHPIGYIAEVKAKTPSLLKFPITEADAHFFSNIVEFVLHMSSSNVFTVSAICRYLSKRRSSDEVKHLVPTRHKIAYKNVAIKFVRLEDARLIEGTVMEKLRHPREKPFKISHLGWAYFWSNRRHPHRSYKEVLLDRYDADPIVDLFIRPYFERQTVEYLIHDIYRGDDAYLFPGPLPKYLEDCCRNLLKDFVYIEFDEELFTKRIRERAKRFILDEILSFGRDPVSIDFSWKDKKLLRTRVQMEVDTLKRIGYEKALVYSSDDKVMALYREIEGAFEQSRRYLNIDRKKKNSY
jgi:hypothetical protein